MDRVGRAKENLAYRTGGGDYINMTEFGKLLILLGVLLVVAGIAILALGRTNLPLGRLPGDIVYHRKNATIYFPLATCVLLSVALTIVLYVLARFTR